MVIQTSRSVWDCDWCWWSGHPQPVWKMDRSSVLRSRPLGPRGVATRQHAWRLSSLFWLHTICYGAEWTRWWPGQVLASHRHPFQTWSKVNSCKYLLFSSSERPHFQWIFTGFIFQDNSAIKHFCWTTNVESKCRMNPFYSVWCEASLIRIAW